MAELVYAHDLKSCLERDVGSIPTPGTNALIVQRIEHRPPKLEMQVRFLLRALVDFVDFFWYFIRVVITTNPPIAQLVEQIPLKDKVVGSIPTGRTMQI